MITADDFLIPLRARGVDFFSGVPCSFLTPLINRVVSDPSLDYVAAASEGEAVAIASGAWLAGRETLVMFQNSGLGNAVNPLTSLNFPFRIPTTVVTTWRAGPGLKDEPQHELMGQITPDLLDVIRIPHRPFPTNAADVDPSLDAAFQYMAGEQLPYAFIMEKGAVRDDGLPGVAMPLPSGGPVDDLTDAGDAPARMASMEAILEVLPDNAGIIATTGKCGRELFTIADRDQHLYQVGSMGCAAGMGLGVALNVNSPVVVLDGDGAALMKLGTFATVGSAAPKNLIHIVLDNGTYDSTGGQPTTAPAVKFARVASACGYARGWEANSIAGLKSAVEAALAGAGPHLIHIKIAPGSMDKLGRPTISPNQVARRFRNFLKPNRNAAG
ncbi:MAG: phosphonopyruvate decarboxylase [Rhodospirillaceae bacterium]